MSDDEFIPGLESLGEAEVRQRLARGNIYGVKHAAIAQEWLRAREAARGETSSSKRDAREEETLAIAKEALSIAKDANRIASEDLAASQSSASSSADAAVAARDAAAAARSQANWAKWAAIIATIAAVIATKDQILTLIFGNP